MCVHSSALTDELTAFYCVLQNYSMTGIVRCFPEDTRQLLEANVNKSLSSEQGQRKGQCAVF